jgi:hypothetical protein
MMTIKNRRMIIVSTVVLMMGVAVVILGFSMSAADRVQAAESILYVDDDTCPVRHSAARGERGY